VAHCESFSPRRLPQQCAEPWYGRGIFDRVSDPEEFRGQSIVIIGGGDSAFDWAQQLREREHRYIKETHYDKLVARLAKDVKLVADQRSRALQDVLWSTAVQHGPGTPLVEAALKPLLRPTTITYSAAGDPSATWRAESIQPDGYGQRFRALGPGIALDSTVTLPGRHNVANALLALASLVAVGIDPAAAVAGIAACPGVPGRLERVPAPGPVIGVVDYAHKPDAIVAALAALRGATEGRLICVIGAGGDRDRAKRPTMGAAAAEGADLVIVTDDNPRTEDPARIRAEVLDGARGGVEVPGRRAAIAEAVARARPGDLVALLGKGHERGQEIGGEVFPFDDRVELAAALSTRFGEAT